MMIRAPFLTPQQHGSQAVQGLFGTNPLSPASISQQINNTLSRLNNTKNPPDDDECKSLTSTLIWCMQMQEQLVENAKEANVSMNHPMMATPGLTTFTKQVKTPRTLKERGTGHVITP
jgi:hypothetical protein